MALAVAGACPVLMWSLWVVFSDSRDAGIPLVILTVLLMVVALTTTLVSPDGALDRTAALSWPPRRAAHLAVAMLIVVAVLGITLVTPARFGPGSLVARDAAGLLGLTALGATVISPSRSWFLPLGWTLAAILFPRSDSVLAEVLTWQSQAPGNVPAAVTSLIMAFGGLVSYALAGPARRATAEVAV
jgi:hypothetical protein